MTFPGVVDNLPKGGLIQHETTSLMTGSKRASVHKLVLLDGSAAHQLVGGVMAHQGYDG